MSLIRLGLPTALLLYFIWRALRQRIFILGIPFLMYMYFSVFFEKMKPFWVPARLGPADHVMIWLLITWVIYFDLLLPRHRRSIPTRQLLGPPLRGLEEAIVAILAAYAVIEIVLTAAHFTNLGSAIGQGKPFLYLIAGYLLLRGMLCHAGRGETIDFLTALVVVNTIAAGLFVLHQGLHLPIYIAHEYQRIVFQGQHLTRSFYFMPQLLPLAIAFCVAKRKWGFFWTGVFVVTLASLWVSYTRSWLLIAMLVFATVLGVRILKGREPGIAIRRALQVVAIGVVFLVLAFALLPVQSHYLLARFHMATATHSLTGDPNLQNRIDKARTVYRWLGTQNHLLGDGFASSAQDARVPTVDVMASDLVWVPILFRLGLLGVAALAGLFAAAGWRALSMTLSADGDAEFLALVLVGLVTGVFLQGFVSWTLLDPSRTPMGIWFLALLAAEAHRRRRVEAGAQAPAAAAPQLAGVVNG